MAIITRPDPTPDSRARSPARRRPTPRDRPVTPRTTQREATRQRVIEAAAELFDSLGYEGATIRAIARHAGVSVGSVFTTFTAKGEILSEVMKARLGRLYAVLDRMTPHLRGSTVDRLRSICAIAMEFETERTKLFLAHIMAAYDWTLPATATPYGQNARIQQVLHDCLAKGVADGDVDPELNLWDIVDMILGVYAWAYRLVVSEGADAAAMTAVLDQRIGLIGRAFAPR